MVSIVKHLKKIKRLTCGLTIRIELLFTPAALPLGFLFPHFCQVCIAARAHCVKCPSLSFHERVIVNSGMNSVTYIIKAY